MCPANVELTGAARLYRAASVLSAMLGIIFFNPVFFPFDSNLTKALAVPIKHSDIYIAASLGYTDDRSTMRRYGHEKIGNC